MSSPVNSSSIFAGVNIDFNDFVLLIILVPIAALIIAIIMDKLSSQVSKIAVYHINEKLIERICKLFGVYFSIECILYLYGAITLIGTMDGVKLSDPNIAYVIIIVACILPISVRIITTTHMISTTEYETAMGIDFKTNRERYLSLLNSYLSIVLTISIFSLVYLLIFVKDGLEFKTLIPDELTFNTYGLICVIIGAIIFPIVSATFGEFMRYAVFRVHEHFGSKLPKTLLIDDQAKNRDS